MSFFRGVLPTRTSDAELPSFPSGVKIWYECGEAVADIVFIHGLTGDRDRTWTHPQANEPWPKTFLPEYVPQTRILTFGYDAYIVRREAAVSNQLLDHSKDFLNSVTSLRQRTGSLGRPLIMVGHSLGGLICKDSILQSKTSTDTHLQDISRSMTAIAFLGTPHGGSDLATWAKIPAKALGIMKSTNTDLLSILQTNSEILARIQNEFLSWLRELDKRGQSLNVTCFWESLPMPHVGTIVAKTSASLAGYNSISIHANHRDMVRFNHREDAGLLSIVGELSRWLDEIVNIASVESTNSMTSDRLRKQQKTECLKSLLFTGMDSRRENIEKPNHNTCEWIFDHPCYKTWESPEKAAELDFLWVKGKPGSGKSTLMKRLMMNHNRPGIDCLSFFFNARGAKIENSSEGLYRSLLFQLLQKCEPAMNAFLAHYLEREQHTLGEKVTWPTPDISEFFHLAMSGMISKPTYIFIDALDECAEDEMRKVVRRFEESLMLSSSRSSNIPLKICVSSRHFPNITLRSIKGQHIFMEEHNGDDIKRYVMQELVLDENRLQSELTSGILKKSVGVFIWTSLVVRRLLKASDQGYTPEQMSAVLTSVPPGLEGLLIETLLSLEEDRRDRLPLLAAWVICAMRPLSPFELFIALSYSENKTPSSLRNPGINPNKFDHPRFDRYLLDASGGLFETAPSGRVQVIHDSVREFFLESQNAASFLRLPEGTNFRQYSHETILAACVQYFNSKEIRQVIPSQYAEEGRIPVQILVAMLYRPIPIPFEVFALLGKTYFYEFVFHHLRWLHQNICTSAEAAFSPAATFSGEILEGWLVVHYYLTLQTGSLSVDQHETLQILLNEPSMIKLGDDEVQKVVRAVNLLVLFVNKTMKDGFTLITRPSWDYKMLIGDGNSSEYFRLFWQCPSVRTVLNVVGPAPTQFRWEDHISVLSKSLARTNFGELVTKQPTQCSFGFGYRIQAAGSRHLLDLQWSWLHGFPSQTVPLEDWQIFEEISPRPLASPKSIVPNASLLQSKRYHWKSITLKTINQRLWRKAISYDLVDTNPTLFTHRQVQAVAVRNDPEFRFYNLHLESENLESRIAADTERND